MRYKILNTITEYPEEAKRIIEPLGSVSYRENLTQRAFQDIIRDYDVVMVQLGLLLHRAELDRAGRLKVIATSTTGLDHIDVSYAQERGIKVISLRGEDAFLRTITGTAELAFGMLIDLVRYSPWAFDSVKDGNWDRDAFRGHNLSGMTLGIVGLGRLGSLMAAYGKAFGMRVVFCDPHVENAAYKKVSFNELLRVSDAVSVHVHLSPETENMFDTGIFSKMKKGAYLINTSRGKIVDEEALLACLKTGALGGYATDVLSGELAFKNNRFSSYPLVAYAKTHMNVIVLPHIGGMTVESRIATDVFIAKKLVACLGTGSRGARGAPRATRMPAAKL